MAKTKPKLMFVYEDEVPFGLTLEGLEAELPFKVIFMTKEQFQQEVTTFDIDLPIVFLRHKGKLTTLINNRKLKKMVSGEELIDLLKSRITSLVPVAYAGSPEKPRG